jgi:xanthine/uracil permease
MHKLHVNQLTAIAAISGALFLLIGTFLHPMEADPNVPFAAFTEYAADRNWVASHLMQLTGMALMVAALVLLSQRMAEGSAKSVAILGEIGAVVGLALAAALQAVDGIALKAMVSVWSTAPKSNKEMLAAWGLFNWA